MFRIAIRLTAAFFVACATIVIATGVVIAAIGGWLNTFDITD